VHPTPLSGPAIATPSTRFVHPSARPFRVLIADDNRDAADTLAELLRLAGCEVAACYDGGAVLPLADGFNPDACVLDIWMPVLDGREAARRLRAWAGDRLLLLIALTGLGGAREVEESLLAGFDHHILKPASPSELFADFAAFLRKIKPVVRRLV
jgi:CheY-like chemotaxis protein